ncbi:MAG TPA: HlyD family type I secretion periplasmic adaptor subunit [Steroidobacteraceae bacterium]|jgi:hemolysin D|nr:HlyD family type I secretion periplasmic adaptor subunit [Steroidobacteraceae bacterium]
MSKLDIARGVSEMEFLPAALEVQESPPSPLGRFTLWAVMAMITLAFIWSIIGRVEIVAVAPGKIIPSGQVKVIQASNIGRVKAILVSDGDSVKAGQPLIELDPTLAEADRQRLESDWVASSLELARWRAYSAWLDNGKAGAVTAAAVDVSAIGGGAKLVVPETSVALQHSLLDQSIAQQRSKIAGIDQTLLRRRAEGESTRQVLEKLRQTLPLVTQRAESLKKLSEQNLVARNTYLEVEQQRIEAMQDFAAQESNLTSTAAAINELIEQRQLALADSRREAFEKLEELEKQNRSQRQELIKASDIAGDQVLTSPVDGVVQQLKVHTVNGVVSPAEQLLVVVPKDQTLEVEARVLNKDIGFVRAGQLVSVKVEAFPFTRYGVIEGTVTSVSNDAIADEKLGLYYAARVRVKKSTMFIDGVDVLLSPGMAVTAEVTTGTRRLIEFVLSPVMEHVQESGRER